jgi:hypothetical protein
MLRAERIRGRAGTKATIVADTEIRFHASPQFLHDASFIASIEWKVDPNKSKFGFGGAPFEANRRMLEIWKPAFVTVSPTQSRRAGRQAHIPAAGKPD